MLAVLCSAGPHHARWVRHVGFRAAGMGPSYPGREDYEILVALYRTVNSGFICPVRVTMTSGMWGPSGT